MRDRSNLSKLRFAATQGLSSRAEALLKDGDRASERGLALSREVDGLRRQLEDAVRDCPTKDRPLCATLNTAGFGVALRLDRVSMWSTIIWGFFLTLLDERHLKMGLFLRPSLRR